MNQNFEVELPQVELSQKDRLTIFFNIGVQFALISLFDSLSNANGYIPNEFPNFADNQQQSKINNTPSSFEEEDEDEEEANSKFEKILNVYIKLKKLYLSLLPENKLWENFEFIGAQKAEEFLDHSRNLFNTLIGQLKEDEAYFLKIAYFFTRYAAIKYAGEIDDTTKEKQKNFLLGELCSLTLSLNDGKIKSIEKNLIGLLGENNINNYLTMINKTKDITFSTYFIKKYSAIDRSKIISDKNRVLSLVRKLDGAHPEHVFLILEAEDNGKSLIWFIDFVDNQILSEIKNSKVRIISFESELMDQELIFRCEAKMMDIRKGDRISCTSWHISKNLADNFIKGIKHEEKNPPKFKVFEQQAIPHYDSNFWCRRAPIGYDCFTWAKEKIKSLNLPNIKISEDHSKSYVFSKTDYVLDDPQKRLTFWYKEPIAIAAIVGTAAVVGGLVVVNREKIYNSCAIQ